LVGNVRDLEGLTYGISASIGGGAFRDGTWTVKASFAPDLLSQGLGSTRRELNLWLEHGVTSEELDYRKTAIAGQFAVGLETSHGLAEQLLKCVERGFELSWLDQFPETVRALTLDQVNTSVKKHLLPANMAAVQAGDLK
jgi:zinc protease